MHSQNFYLEIDTAQRILKIVKTERSIRKIKKLNLLNTKNEAFKSRRLQRILCFIIEVDTTFPAVSVLSLPTF